MKKSLNLIFSLLICSSLFAQNITSDAGMTVPEDRIRTSNEGFASEEFRRGVQAYYKGSFNEAIVQFEKALSFMPNDSLILDWLGKSYYKTGLEGSALSYWQSAQDNGYGGILLANKIEVVRERRVTGDANENLMRLSEAGSYPGVFNGNMIYSGPISILPNYDGTFWIAAYNTNNLLLMNQNGSVIDRIAGPINGFDRPSDIIRMKDGNILVSESAGNRLSLLNQKGHFIKYIGQKGRDLGGLIGPQYLSLDGLSRIYVTDFGNRRVDVFDAEGNPLYFFGGKSAYFEGLKGPTGICVLEDSVFVADSISGCIYEFDRAGNYIRELVEKKTFKKPEAIKLWNNYLVVCDQNKVIAVDSQTGSLFEYVKTGNAPSRVTTAAVDVNENLLVSDYTANEVYVMSKLSELVGGLFVQIEQIDSSKFPEITLEVRVENRHRQPVVGLMEQNFYISEKKQPVQNMKFIGAASNNTEADITLVIERSRESLLHKTEIETAVRELAASMNEKGVLRVVSAGKIPVTEYVGSPFGVRNFSLDALKNPVSDTVAVDLALRLSSNDLINAAKKRAIIFISGGSDSALNFDSYNLSQLTAYMCNNSIMFSVIQVTQGAVNPKISYISENTNGDMYYVYREEGLSNIVNEIIQSPQGIYQLSYMSTQTSNMGEKYLPAEIEVYLLNRSGRDETGYFAPLL
ncbi:MAG: hypothetical protein K6C98_01695 [Treponema sp.]|nr:hypothetical protein [Treponema sp.]